MADQTRRIVMHDCRGGMNGVDDPLSLQPNQCVYAYNVDWFRASVAHKRHGSTEFSMTSATMTGKVSALIRHVPGTSETVSELWAVDDAATPIVNRYNSSAWSAPTLKDNITGNGWDVHGASVDGKLYLAYASAVNRLHVWDGSTVRRSGIDPGANAPTVANTGAGAYAATLRYYRVRFSDTTARVSEPTPSVSFTPSGGGTAARVTMPTAPGEGETHWILEASSDNVTFYQIAYTVVGTTTFDDTIAVASYSSYTLSPSTGTFTLHKPYKFVAADQNRLLGFGSHNASDKQHRVWWSDLLSGVTLGALGNPTIDAVDRLNTTGGYFLDLDEHDSGVPTGLAGPLNGNFYAFKSTQLWELRATGDTVAPFKATAISKTIGAVGQRAIIKGEDAEGRPCLYFMSQFGPYRYGANGLEYIGRNIDNYIRGTLGNAIAGTSSTIKLAPSSVATLTLYYPSKRQVWFWFAVNDVSDSNGPTTCLMYDVQTGGWAEQSLTSTRAVALYAHPSLGLPTLVPYMAYSASNETIWVLDNDSATTDANSSNITAYIVTRPIEPGGPGFQGSVSDVEVLTSVTTGGGTITVQAEGDLGTSVVSTASLTLTNTSGNAWLRTEAPLGDCHAVHYRIGDLTGTTNRWRIQRLVFCAHPQEAWIG